MRAPLLRLFGFYRPHWPILAASAVVLSTVNLSVPLTQHLIGLALEDIRTGKAVTALPGGGFDARVAWLWAAGIAGLALGRAVLSYLGTLFAHHAGQGLLHDMRLAIFTKVQELHLRWHLAHGTGEVVTRTTRDSDKVRDALTGGWRTLLETVLIVGAALGLLYWYHPLLGLVPSLLTVLAGVLVWRQAARIAVLEKASGEAYDKVTQDLTEGVNGVRVIKAFGLESARISTFAGHVATYAAAWAGAVRYIALHLPLPQIIVGLGQCWVLWCGAVLIAGNALTPGELAAAAMVMLAVIFRIEAIGQVQQLLAEAGASAARITELLDATPDIASGDAELPTGRIGLAFRGVGVTAPGGASVLHDLDLALAPGEIVALVGATGSGKSTLAALSARLSDPAAGSIFLVPESAPGGGDARRGEAQPAGTNLRRLRLPELRRAVQIVFQDSFLFSASVAENLRLNAPQASDADLHAALAAAAASEIVAGLSDGLASRVGERGVTLSGGQRQRLCLARALIAKPAVLVLDDATSALDAITESTILAGLRRDRGTTMLIVASKLSTILLADRVALLDGGRIAATGTHDDLLATCPAYRDLLGA